jgi:hypothetical protein
MYGLSTFICSVSQSLSLSVVIVGRILYFKEFFSRLLPPNPPTPFSLPPFLPACPYLFREGEKMGKVQILV